MTHLPDKLLIAAGVSVALIAAGFFLVGAHHEFAERLRQYRRGGGFLSGGDN